MFRRCTEKMFVLCFGTIFNCMIAQKDSGIFFLILRLNLRDISMHFGYSSPQVSPLKCLEDSSMSKKIPLGVFGCFNVHLYPLEIITMDILSSVLPSTSYTKHLHPEHAYAGSKRWVSLNNLISSIHTPWPPIPDGITDQLIYEWGKGTGDQSHRLLALELSKIWSPIKEERKLIPSLAPLYFLCAEIVLIILWSDSKNRKKIGVEVQVNWGFDCFFIWFLFWVWTWSEVV